jgi:formate-nitrite transporter family protein
MNQLTPPVAELDHRRGSLDAPSVLVQFGDYECPSCKAVYPIIKQLLAEAGDQLCFVYRHFPLTDIHRHAELAAEAAEAAEVQRRFWDMHDLLYENSPALTMSDLLNYARELDLEVDRIRLEVRSHLFLSRVLENVGSGLQSGVKGTPTFFINGAPYDGGHDLESLLDAIRVAR